MAQSGQAINHAHKAAKRATTHVPREKTTQYGASKPGRATDHAGREPRKAGERRASGTERASQNGSRNAQRPTDHVARETEKATARGAREIEKANQNGAREAERATQGAAAALRQQTQRIDETGHEAARQGGEITAAAITRAAHSSVFADHTQETVGVWACYAQDLLHNGSEAGEALFRACSLTAMMQVQATLMYGNLQAFLRHWSRLSDIATRVGLRPFFALEK
ncbi:MAG: hypothetical protein JOY71_06040 [Acetobacteraceae bacterium]|nr:hypothetical protein [Acetobacteraceae bacterium]